MNIWHNKQAIQEAVMSSRTRTEVIEKLGMNPKGSITRRKLNEAIERFEIDDNHLASFVVDWSDIETIATVVAQSLSMTNVLETLGLVPRSGNFATAMKYINKYGLDISHFDPITAGQNKKVGSTHEKIPLVDILQGNHPTYRTYNLKQRLINEGLKEHKCEGCGLTDWLGNVITLDLDHINGVPTDHRLDNLRLLCPNCHSQTPTYKGRNKGALAKSVSAPA